jgi:hypothetical protein
MQWPGFVGASSHVQSPVADCSRLVNLYLEPNDSESGLPALYPTPGQAAFITAAAGITDVGTRALATMNARVFGVIGGGVYELFAAGTATRYGAVIQDANPADIAFNGISGNQALFSSGGNAYWLNLTTHVLSAAVLTNEATQIGMLDGYGLAFNRVTGTLRLSDLNDFSVWDPTMFARRSSAPDAWLAMIVNAPDVWLLGEQSGDVWYDNGGSTFPLAPRSGASFPYGIGATFSLKAAGDSVLWLSQNAQGAGIVVRARGYVPQPIGSHALDTAIAGYQRTSIITDAEALVYQRSGHTFYVLKFPSANATWMYDLSTNLWTELGTENPAANRVDAWHPRAITYAFGKHLVGESGTGTVAMLDDTVGTEADGTPIVRVRVPPALVAGDGRLFIDRFELQILHGLGTLAGQGADPVAMLRWSKDFGQTWGNERRAGLGRMGETDARTYWLRCGSAPTSMVPEIRISDPIPTRITGALVDARGAQRKAA